MPELAVKEGISVEDMLEVWDALLYQSDIVPLVTRAGCQRMQLIEKHAGGMGCTTVGISHCTLGHADVPGLAVKQHTTVEDMLEVWDMQV